ncbi:MAG: glutathione S-transferase family protein [Rhodobacteraceae bacterium]|nr:glutathione S-transferase family protein [Paracoccaceae bacterium]
MSSSYAAAPRAEARLFHLPLSPFCRKVRLSLAEKGIKVELIEEHYWKKRREFLARNPAGKVPVLEMGKGVLSESSAICEFLEEQYPDPPLMPTTVRERHEVRRLIAWFDDTFYNEVVRNLLYERLLKKVMGRGHPDSARVMEGARAIKEHLDYLGSLLEHRRWLAGNRLSLADFAAAAHISTLDYISDIDWNRSAALRVWYATLKSRPAFRSLLADKVPGFPPSSDYANLDF